MADETNNTNVKMPPCDIEAEKAVLGAMLKNPDAAADVIDMLKPKDFYLKEHELIFDAFLDMYRKNISIDLMTANSTLRTRKDSERTGGLSYLSRLMDEAIVTSNARYYADVIRSKSRMRELISEANRISDMAYDEQMDPDEIMNNAEQAIFQIAQSSQKSNYLDINDVIVENIRYIQELAASGEDIPGVKTGFRKVDEILGGIHGGEMVILAARPGVGKTAFALNIASNAAVQGSSVIIFSLEMTNRQLGERMLAMAANVDMEKIKNGKLDENDWESLSIAQDSFEDRKIVIDQTPGISLLELKNKCRRRKAEAGLDLVIVDYLQLMSLGFKVDAREKEVSALTRQLKLMSLELDCAVMVLSQLNRGPENRADHRPQLSDLRESGSIEQDADVVIFLRREDMYNKEDEPADTEAGLNQICDVDIAKHRNGKTGVAQLTWIGRYTKFGNLAYENEYRG